jgi:hypothetical protein
MPAIFPKWTNWLPLAVGVALSLIGGVVAAGVTYYCTPKYTRVGYHTVDKSWFASIPAASTCMNCHSLVLKDDPRLALVRESVATGKPIPWVQVHIVPDYVYFNHEVHVARGFSCVECHGRVDQMDEVRHAKSLSMSFCLECHRNPAAFVRPVDKVTDLGWQWSTNAAVAARMQHTNGAAFVHDWKIESLQSCSACHR